MKILQEMTLEEGLSLELDTTFDKVQKTFREMGFAPSLSTQNIKFHLDTLTKGYFDKVDETGSPFAFCGAKLHSIWWEQFNEGKGNSTAVVEELGYDSEHKLVEAIQAAADNIQGNGWVVVTKDSVTPIPNHSYAAFDDIVLLVDLWEHSYQLDYKADKKAYIKHLITKSVSWDVIAARLNVPSRKL